MLKLDEAIWQAQHQAQSGILLSIKTAGNTKQQALPLHMASLHPNVYDCAKTADSAVMMVDVTYLTGSGPWVPIIKSKLRKTPRERRSE
jgi:hypothetical protein